MEDIQVYTGEKGAYDFDTTMIIVLGNPTELFKEARDTIYYLRKDITKAKRNYIVKLLIKLKVIKL